MLEKWKPPSTWRFDDMSAAYYIVLNSESPGFDTSMDGKSLSRESVWLNDLAEDCELANLNYFVSASPDDLADFADDLGVDLPVEVPQEKWYAAETGIKYFEALLQRASEDTVELRNKSGVTDDLKAILGILEQAKKTGLKWHLAVDY